MFYRILLLIIFFTFQRTFAFSGINLQFFNSVERKYDLISYDYTNYLYFGNYNKLKSARANVGFDFPILSLQFSSSGRYSLGASALVHLFMFPDNRIFPVDNFYAVFNIWLQGAYHNLVWRFYPFYHLSAHLSDGYMDTDKSSYNFTGKIKEDKHAVSNEMFYALIYYSMPFGPNVMFGAGYYFHRVYRVNLKGRIDVDIAYDILDGKSITPSLIFKTELIYENGIRPGADFFAGIKINSGLKNGMGLYIRYFDKPQTGQYFYNREEGLGLNINFIF